MKVQHVNVILGIEFGEGDFEGQDGFSAVIVETNQCITIYEWACACWTIVTKISDIPWKPRWKRKNVEDLQMLVEKIFYEPDNIPKEEDLALRKLSLVNDRQLKQAVPSQQNLWLFTTT